MTYSSDRTRKLRITKVYFSMVTVIKVDDSVHQRYYTSTEPGVLYPVLEVIETETDWQKTLVEAEGKGVKIETEEFPLMGEERPALRPFPETYGDWVNLAEDLKSKYPDDPVMRASINYQLQHVMYEEEERPEDREERQRAAQEAKRWLTERTGEHGIA